MPKKKRYRPNVAAVILSSNYPERCEFFIAHRSDIKGAWQFPQGGIDEGESPQEALFRELREEIGCNEVDIIAEYPEWITYDFPRVARGKCYPFDGQTQKFFLVRLKKRATIDLRAFEVPEFEEYAFVPYEVLFERVTYFKRKVYRRVIDYFIRKGHIDPRAIEQTKNIKDG